MQLDVTHQRLPGDKTDRREDWKQDRAGIFFWSKGLEPLRSKPVPAAPNNTVPRVMWP